MAPEPPGELYTVSDHFAQLNDIDKEVVKLLRSASLAVKVLTALDPTQSDDLSRRPSVQANKQKDSFAAATSSYFATLSALDGGLRRQILALEEADVLPAEVFTKQTQGNLPGLSGGPAIGGSLSLLLPKVSGKGTITGGGLGNLDIGWLNSRNDHIGKEKEAELWEEAQRLVESVEKGNIGNGPEYRDTHDKGTIHESLGLTQYSSERMQDI